ncbi:Saccharopine dehydrogenase NAD+, L-lysine-forming [Hondaea fermentalgiana]|uniref:Saccharopine dehydrogenase NAD+, L-lysine-forming n=1 Tax=Hondaea fermentalgiana TaxID=2315210 RepID=A0A2R5G8Y9_9STRA|nr:Saccharopine dehydrogenase NAD+, L-lysine-forming [Hondaea fermentalgiana]|eukprot:GBG26799.1 Saccharopine dehydrogenase NAD+, L-lysine-forming [Hondaea fermentalgiana]
MRAGTRGSVGIVREAYSAWERRAPFTPEQVQRLVNKYGVDVVVQPSGKRVFADGEFERAGATLSDDLSGCAAIFGVKQAPIDTLLKDKTYLFFSHTIKGQLENMELLDKILEKNIRLIDYECITKNGTAGAPRLVAFGQYAGMAGMIDAIRGVGQQLLHQGLSSPFLSVGSAYMYPSYETAKCAVRDAGRAFTQQRAQQVWPDRFDPLVFLFTGRGNVNQGARQVFYHVPHRMVPPEDLERVLHEGKDLPPIIGCQVDLHHMVERRTDGGFDRKEYYTAPEKYKSVFYERLARHANVLVNGIYWDARFPRVLAKRDLERTDLDRRLHFVADISCDIGGGIEILDRSTTIEDPFLVGLGPKNDLDVMGVDILPSELPREASQHFGDYLLPFVAELAQGTPTASLAAELQGACIADQGELRPRYTYIDQLRRERLRELNGLPLTDERSSLQIEGSAVLRLSGHLFDTGLVNRMLDIVEAQSPHGRFHIVECMVGSQCESTMLLQLTMDGGRKQLDQVLTRMNTLVGDPEFAEAEAKLEELPSSFCNGDFKATIQPLGECEDTQADQGGATPRAETAGALAGGRTLAMQRALSLGPGPDAKDTAGFLDQGKDSSSKLIAPSLTKVAVLGAGMVAKPCAELLSRDSSRHVFVVSAMPGEAESLCARVGRTNLEAVLLNAQEEDDRLAALIKDCDAVISLLPQTMHVPVARHCIKAGTPLVTASYVSPEMRSLHEEAKAKGVPILCEMGLDPGMDHMSAQQVIDEMHEEGIEVKSFSSVCGGLPAPEAADNPFGYKFSWSPRGVLMAMRNPAKYLKDGAVVQVRGEDLLTAAEPFRMYNLPSLALEQLPNRDSTMYAEAYRIPEAATCFRGTLRYEGFSALMIELVNAGFLREDTSLAEILAAFPKSGSPGADAVQWLLDANYDDKKHGAQPAMDGLCALLESKLALKPGERDMTVMQHSFNDGERSSKLLVYGSKSDTAMARTVGLTAAIGVELMLDPVDPLASRATGVLVPTLKSIYKPALDRLASEGLVFHESVRA